MIERRPKPERFNVEVSWTYEGKTIGSEFFEKHPEKKKLYISKDEYSKLKDKVKNKTSKGMQSLIEISEHGIKEHIDYKNL